MFIIYMIRVHQCDVGAEIKCVENFDENRIVGLLQFRGVIALCMAVCHESICLNYYYEHNNKLHKYSGNDNGNDQAEAHRYLSIINQTNAMIIIV